MGLSPTTHVDVPYLLDKDVPGPGPKSGVVCGDGGFHVQGPADLGDLPWDQSRSPYLSYHLDGVEEHGLAKNDGPGPVPLRDQ